MIQAQSLADDLRRSVSETYARASASAATAKLAGYTDNQFAQLPNGVEAESFGCGNPLSFAHVRAGDTVLDLGSGAGIDVILAANVVGEKGRVIGIDMTDEMIARAQKNIARAELSNAEIRKGVIEQLPVETASVDWVISNCVISLSPEKERVFEEVARVLKPGGQMLISDIMVDDKLAWLLKRLTNIAPSIAMARTEEHYLNALAHAGLIDGEIKNRFVYQPEHLVGLFGDEFLAPSAASSACPISSLGAGLRRSPLAKQLLGAGARTASGHVWSSKLYARKSERAE